MELYGAGTVDTDDLARAITRGSSVTVDVVASRVREQAARLRHAAGSLPSELRPVDDVLWLPQGHPLQSWPAQGPLAGFSVPIIPSPYRRIECAHAAAWLEYLGRVIAGAAAAGFTVDVRDRMDLDFTRPGSPFLTASDVWQQGAAVIGDDVAREILRVRDLGADRIRAATTYAEEPLRAIAAFCGHEVLELFARPAALALWTRLCFFDLLLSPEGLTLVPLEDDTAVQPLPTAATAAWEWTIPDA